MFIPKKDNGGDKGGHKTKGINKDIVKKKKDLMRRDKYLISTFLIVLNLVWVELNKLGFTFLLLRKRLLAVLQHCLYCWENLNFVI